MQKGKELFVTLVTEVSLISREPNLRSERISISGPVGEVVTIRPGNEVGIEFRRDELSVHCLVLAFFFAAILQFDLSGLSFSLSGSNFCTHQVI